MPKPITKKQMADLWYDEFLSENNCCCLCGNHGMIDTRNRVYTPAGVHAGAVRPCICPNGRALKKAGITQLKHTNMTVEPNMESAGAEISRYAFDMEKLGLPKDDVNRLLKIGAWASMGKMSDYEMALVQIAGGVVRVMKDHGYPFREDKPIVDQWDDFVKGLPLPQ